MSVGAIARGRSGREGADRTGGKREGLRRKRAPVRGAVGVGQAVGLRQCRRQVVAGGKDGVARMACIMARVGGGFGGLVLPVYRSTGRNRLSLTSSITT